MKRAASFGCVLLVAMFCTTLAVSCDQASCTYRSKCLNVNSGHICECRTPGFHYDGNGCMDYNECEKLHDPCDSSSTCINTAGSYMCLCNEGYTTGDGTVACQDLDECQQSLARCPMHSTCTNTVGSYYCQCKPGYLGAQNKCQDIDECLGGAACHNNSVCVNTDGSYSCMCNIGYKLDNGKCVDVNECQQQLDQCNSNALCHNTDGSYICACKHGYYGDGTHCFDTERKAIDCASKGICQQSSP